jgi:cytochrome c biogenesis protein CcmG/thiol:disulfide interchange protein DsbE
VTGRRPKRTLLLRGVVIAAVAITALFVAVRQSPQPAPAGVVSTQRTSWQLPRLGGSGQVTLASLRGHPLVLDFFASWCTACRGELPGLAGVSAELKGKVTFAGVDSEETGDGLAMAHRYGIDWWPLAIDSGGAQNSGLHDDLGVMGMPVTAFYDAGGRLLTVVPGAISETDLRTRLRDLFGVTA